MRNKVDLFHVHRSRRAELIERSKREVHSVHAPVHVRRTPHHRRTNSRLSTKTSKLIYTLNTHGTVGTAGHLFEPTIQYAACTLDEFERIIIILCNVHSHTHISIWSHQTNNICSKLVFCLCDSCAIHMNAVDVFNNFYATAYRAECRAVNNAQLEFFISFVEKSFARANFLRFISGIICAFYIKAHEYSETEVD